MRINVWPYTVIRMDIQAYGQGAWEIFYRAGEEEIVSNVLTKARDSW